MASTSSVGAGQTLGIVGESGCGKTMLSRAVLQLLPKKAKLSGRVMFDGQDLVSLDRESCASCAAARWRWCSRTR